MAPSSTLEVELGAFLLATVPLHSIDILFLQDGISLWFRGFCFEANFRAEGGRLEPTNGCRAAAVSVVDSVRGYKWDHLK